MKFIIALFAILVTSHTFADEGAQFGLDKRILYPDCIKKQLAEGASEHGAREKCKNLIQKKEEPSGESSEGSTSDKITVATDDGYTSVDASILEIALETLNDAQIQITPEGVLTTGAILGSATLMLKFSRSANPIGALIVGLGVTPVAASDYCSRFSGESGLKVFLSLPLDQQMEEVSICPDLAGDVLKISSSLN